MAIRSIEESNPDIEFDWTRILKEQSSSEAQTQNPRPGIAERRSSRRPGEQRGARPAAPGDRPALEPTIEIRPPEIAIAAESSPEPDQPGGIDASHLTDTSPELPAFGLDGPGESEIAPIVDDVLTPAHARLGAEGLLRLRARHAEILARISERVQDSARQDELKAQAERLNPDTWVTDEEVSAGLEGYESVLESLRAVVGQGRRRRRRDSRAREGSPAGHSSTPVHTSGAANESGSPAARAGDSDDDAEDEGAQ